MLLKRFVKDMFRAGEKPGAPEPAQPAAARAQGDGDEYRYSADWFSMCIPVWQELFSQLPDVVKILEIGSFEGRSTVWLIENGFKAGAKADIYCVDTWQGGVEHQGADMAAIEQRFLRNVEIARARSAAAVTVHVRKGPSAAVLAGLAAEGHASSFDAVYVDGSHQCPDVLHDLVLAFQLCRVGGVIICDDYDWSQEPPGSEDLLNQPKLAIDSFVNCYRRKLEVVGITLRQAYLRKSAA